MRRCDASKRHECSNTLLSAEVEADVDRYISLTTPVMCS